MDDQVPSGFDLLDATDPTPQHRFASPSLRAADEGLLNYLLQDVRTFSRRLATCNASVEPHEELHWDVFDLRRRIVACNPSQMTARRDMYFVGFLGDRRRDRDQDRIDDAESALVEELAAHPGICSYSSMELVDGYWANLVIHTSLGDRESWRASTRHRQAVDEISPMAYRSVRIYNGEVLGGIVGSNAVLAKSTKYWDYDSDPTWSAIRFWPAGPASRQSSSEMQNEKAG